MRVLVCEEKKKENKTSITAYPFGTLKFLINHHHNAPPAGCKDANKACADWAAVGECESNPGFMVGQPGQAGQCLLSCNRCDLMPKSTLARKGGSAA